MNALKKVGIVTALLTGVAAAPAALIADFGFEISGCREYASADFWMQAGRAYRIETTDLSAGCDTVLLVRASTDHERAHEYDPVLGQNDDRCRGDLSSVVIPDCTSSGWAYAHVRAYGANTGGTGRVIVTDITGEGRSFPPAVLRRGAGTPRAARVLGGRAGRSIGRDALAVRPP